MKFRFCSTLSVMVAMAMTSGLQADPTAADSGPSRIKLFLREQTITVLGKSVKVGCIQQADGTPGYSPNEESGFHVEVVNQLPVPSAIHWHGLVLPNAMDGVPYVTQLPIPPGGTQNYDFPLQQHGTYWMHSHYGLQEQQLVTAPMVIHSSTEPKLADAEVAVTLNDFSFSSPEQILKSLAGDMSGGMSGMGDMSEKGMSGMNMSGKMEDLTVQQWDADSNRFVARQTKAMSPDIDVKYDALLANLHTLDHPQIVKVAPGSTVLVRLIASSSATNYFIDTGKLDATVVATDGADVQPVKGNFFQLAIAQRLDLLVTIPKAGGAFPILALGEGTKMRSGIVLSTSPASVTPPSILGKQTMGSLDNTQELRFVAKNPLPDKPVQRSLPSTLGGTMMPYVWTINGLSYPNHSSLDVKQGERVELVIKNESGMSHPMHLHGHVFEVTEIDGHKIQGAVRDTVLVPPQSTIKVVFDANNPGVWPYHCHIAYHMETGMFTVLKYDGTDTPFWNPDGMKLEMQNPLTFSQAFWNAMTGGLLAETAQR